MLLSTMNGFRRVVLWRWAAHRHLQGCRKSGIHNCMALLGMGRRHARPVDVLVEVPWLWGFRHAFPGNLAQRSHHTFGLLSPGRLRWLLVGGRLQVHVRKNPFPAPSHPLQVANPRIPARGDSSASEPHSDSEFDLVRHEGKVFLDRISGAAIITHTATLEQKTLPADHDWLLTFVDGFGALSADTSDQVLLLEHRLDKRLYFNESAGFVIVPDGASSLTGATSLSQWQRSYSEYTTTWSSSSLFADISLPFFRLSYPRQGSSWFVDPSCFYKLLSMTSYMGQASKWVFESMNRWSTMLQKYGMRDQVMKSSAGVSAQEAPDISRFLPRPALSLRATLCVLWRWSCGSAKDGGLRAEEGRTKALSLAMAMIDGIVRTELPENVDITIDFNLDWKIMRPRPQVMKDPLVLHLSPGGHLDISRVAGHRRGGRDAQERREEQMVRLLERLGH